MKQLINIIFRRVVPVQVATIYKILLIKNLPKSTPRLPSSSVQKINEQIMISMIMLHIVKKQ